MDSLPTDPEQLTPEQREAAYRKVVSKLWHRGNLRFKLHETQLKILDALEKNTMPMFYLLCSRRLGKSYMLVCMALQQALRKPNSRILYLAPHAKDAANIVNDLASQILADCPKELRPEYKGQDKEFHFKNGSIVRLKATNGEHAQYLRGGAADLIILDECGMMDDLKHVVEDICTPMTLTTGGRIFLATTPPRSPGHESATLFETLAGQNATVLYTILDAPHLTPEAKLKALSAAGEKPEHIADILAGKRKPSSTTARREYFCEFVTDAASAVVKEFDEQAQKEIVRTYNRPSHFDAYVAMDPGMKDRTGILFAYWDFTRAKLVIEDELLLSGPNTSKIAYEIQRKEEELWPGRQPFLRILDSSGDGGMRLIADLATMHGIIFSAARKEDAMGGVNLMRNDVQTRTLVVDPRCSGLIRQLKNATWNNRGSDFVRGGEGSLDGHYDLVSALRYLCRSIVRSRNPYPHNYWAPGGEGGLPHNTWISPKGRRSGQDLGLLSDTPFSRRLVRRRKR